MEDQVNFATVSTFMKSQLTIIIFGRAMTITLMNKKIQYIIGKMAY